MNYEKIVKELEAEDLYAIAKLSIYHELRWWFEEYGMNGTDIEDVVDFVTDLYLRSKTEMVAAAVALRVILCGVSHSPPQSPRKLVHDELRSNHRISLLVAAFVSGRWRRRI